MKKQLLKQLETVYSIVTHQVTDLPAHSVDEKHFNERALKEKYTKDWRLLRQLNRLEKIREEILCECGLLPHPNLFRRPHSKYSSSIMRRFTESFIKISKKEDHMSDDDICIPSRMKKSTLDYDEEFFDEDVTPTYATKQSAFKELKGDASMSSE